MKVIRVESCRLCPLSRFKPLTDWACWGDTNPPGRPIEDTRSIPDWCPLEDSE